MPLRRVLDRQRLGEPDDAALRRDVVRHAVGARLRARRRDRDDPAPAGREHVGDRGLDAVERAGEVDRRACASHASSVMSVNDSNSSMPALVTMISIGPSSARTFASAASTAARSVTSTADADGDRARRPRMLRGRGCVAASPSRSSSATRLPCAREALGRSPSPMPDAAARDHCDPARCAAHRAPSDRASATEYGRIPEVRKLTLEKRERHCHSAGPPLGSGHRVHVGRGPRCGSAS